MATYVLTKDGKSKSAKVDKVAGLLRDGYAFGSTKERAKYDKEFTAYRAAQATPAGNTGNLANDNIVRQDPNQAASSGLQVRLANGTTQTFKKVDEGLNRALKAGGKILDPLTGQPMTMTANVYGGWLANGLPLNVVNGDGWMEGQREIMSNYYAAGWRPGQPALAPDKAPPIPQNIIEKYWPAGGPTSGVLALQTAANNGGNLYPGLPADVRPMPKDWKPATVNAPGGGGAGAPGAGAPGGGAGTPGSTMDFGYLSRPFTEQFDFPDLPLSMVARPFTEQMNPTTEFPTYKNAVDAPPTFKAPGTAGDFQSKTQFGGYTPQGAMPDKFSGVPVTPEFRSSTAFPGYTPQGALPDEFSADVPLDDFEQLTEEELLRDPGYRFRMSEMEKALGRKQSAGAVRLGGRSLREIARYSGELASQEYGAANERKLIEHQLRNAKNQEEYNRILTKYGLDVQRSDNEYARGQQDFATQYGISAEQYNRERDAYALATARNEQEYQRKLVEFDRNFQVSQEEYGRGVQDFGIRNALSGEEYARERDAYAMSVANNQDEYQRALAEFDSQNAANQTLYNRNAQDFSLKQMASGEAWDRERQGLLDRFAIDTTNQARISDEYQKAYGRAFGEYGTRFDIDRANKNDIYNRFAGVAGFGQTAGTQMGTLGANFGATAGGTMQNGAMSLADIWAGGAFQDASGKVASGNAWRDAFSNIAKNTADIYARRRVGATA